MIYIVLISLVIGLFIGYNSPIVIPLAYSKLFSVALVAALDAAFGGLRAATSERFDKHVFVTGFFSNTLLAAALVFIGDRLGIDLYYVALLAFGFRILPSCVAICSKTIGAERAEREKKLKIFLRYGNISSFMVK